MNIAECYRLLELTSTANLHEVKASYRRLARRWHPDVNPDNHQAHDMFIRVTKAYKVLQKVVPPVPKTAPTSVSPRTQPTHAGHQTVEPPPPKVKVSVRTSKPQPQTQPTNSTKSTVESPSRVKVPGHSTDLHRSSTSPKRPASSKTAQPRGASVGGQSTPSPTQTHQGNTYGAPRSSTLNNQKLKYDSYRQLQDLIKHKRFPRAIALVEALRQRLPEDLEIRQWQAIIYQSSGRQLIRERRFEQARAYLKKALNTDPHNKSLWAEVEKDFQSLEKVY